MANTPQANDGKKLEVTIDGKQLQRIPLKTKLVLKGDVLDEIITEFAADKVEAGDTLFVTEKIVAITQGRSFTMDEIEPRPLARFLSKYVTKTAHGIGLGLPETMEMALRECGTPRILFAAGVSAITKLFGRRGDFYRIAGPQARAIDGPTGNTIPPYNKAVVLGPLQPNEVSKHLQTLLPAGVEVAVVDINDLGGNILGSTLSKEGEASLLKALKDNPLGQDHEQTPLGIIRAA